ncbi:hypothetical protein J6590_016054 [Homalodisca vitripennis]|nr:hypothetical protein J6590_016054 [Homalodisca vitripennis]
MAKGTIKDVHTAAVTNDPILLRKRTEDPVPREILLAKDKNGLTPLHKIKDIDPESLYLCMTFTFLHPSLFPV